MASWDDDDSFEPPSIPVTLSNKWVGEDEDDDVKESWEDEDDEKKEDDEKQAIEVKKPKKKTLEEKIAEKEAKKREELEKRLEQEEEISPEERLRMQKESDLKLALETTFGDKDGVEDEEIGGLKLPSTKEEFDEFTNTLSKKLTPLSRHGNEYVDFTEGLARNLCAVMSSLDIKKIKNTLDNLYLEKQKIEKGDKIKKGKGKGKAKLKLEGDNQLSAYVNDYANDFDYDDFM